MSISMIGIDYKKASVDVRAQFSFTKKNAAAALENLKKEPGILGCIILSTCNRMEIWASTGEDWKGSLYEFLCREKEKDPREFEKYFVKREEEEAVEHLFYLTSGLKSQILAEDQIITQVKDALALSREAYCTDNVLEVLFRMAVTAAKKVKTQVSFSRANSSVIHQAIERLEDQGFSLQGKTCMVIGNGEMGKVTALALKEAGADVTVTVRQYSRINYGERLEFLPKCDLVVSATASPNYTLTMEQIENAKIPGHVVLIDLAVPRDIEPSAGTLNNVTLYDIDSFKIDAVSPKLQASLDQAGEILREQQEEFYNWYNGRDLIPRIQEIKADAVEDLNLRIMKILRKTPMEDSDRENLLKAIDTAAGVSPFCRSDRKEDPGGGRRKDRFQKSEDPSSLCGRDNSGGSRSRRRAPGSGGERRDPLPEESLCQGGSL